MLRKRSRFVVVVTAVFLLILCVALFDTVLWAYPVASEPFTVPCVISTYGNAWEGSLTFGLFEYDPANASLIRESYLVVMGTNGQLLHLREYNDTMGDYGLVKYISNDTLMFQGEPGQTTHFWNLETNMTTDFPGVTGYHHDIDYNPVEDTFLALKNYVRRVNGTDVLFDKVVELNATGNALWTWDTYDHLSLGDACPYNDTWPVEGEAVMDFTHCNALQWNYNQSVAYLNVRNLNTFYKINMTTGEVIWGCGEHGNFTLLDADGREVSSLWYHSHALEEVEPDVFAMFDNDYHNQTDINDAHSRILEVTLNEQDMTARESWSWEAPEEYWSPYWGKVDRLSNGDRIGTFGTQTKQYNSSIGAVLVEVNPQSQIVRTYTFPRDWGIYRTVEQDQAITSGKSDPTPVIIVAMIVVAALAVSVIVPRVRKPPSSKV